jgi:hypothetical protein
MNGLSKVFLIFDLDNPNFDNVCELVLDKELLDLVERMDPIDIRSGDIERTFELSLIGSRKDFEWTPGCGV